MARMIMGTELVKTIHVKYYAGLREQRGLNQETLTTNAKTAAQLYDELQKRHGFKLSTKFLKVAVNDEYRDWQIALKNGDTIVFIPPVAGG